MKYTLIGIGATVLVGATLAYFLFRKRIKCSSKFLFIGDSNTAGSNSYADVFASKCSNPKNKKIAKSGAKTSWMLRELTNELKRNDYDVVTILGGSNDIFGERSISNAKKNMDMMLRSIKKSGAKAIVVTPPYKGFYPATTQKHWNLIKEWNEYLKSHPIPFKYVPFHSIVKDKSLFLSDGQHVNNAGHRKLAENYSKKLNIS